MPAIKVYLAKSNLSEHSDLIETRSLLNKAGYAITECERFYSVTDLSKCDVLLVLGHDLQSRKVGERIVYVIGKGLFSTIMDWKKLKNSDAYPNVWFVLRRASDIVIVRVLHMAPSGVGDWKKNYAYIETGVVGISLTKDSFGFPSALNGQDFKVSDVDKPKRESPTPKKRRLLS